MEKEKSTLQEQKVDQGSPGGGILETSQGGMQAD